MARRAAGARAAAARAARPKPPFHRALFQDDHEDHNIAESIFETKAGVRACCLGVDENTFQATLTNSKVNQAMKSNRTHLKNGVGAVKVAL